MVAECRNFIRANELQDHGSALWTVAKCRADVVHEVVIGRRCRGAGINMTYEEHCRTSFLLTYWEESRIHFFELANVPT